MGKIIVKQTGNKNIITNRLEPPEAINEREMAAIVGGMVAGIAPVTCKKKKKESFAAATFVNVISLRKHFQGVVSKKMFLDALFQIVGVIKECEKNLMNVNNLMLNPDYIFLDSDSKKVQCIFWPVTNSQLAQSPAAFFSELPFHLVFNKNEDNGYVSEYIMFLKKLSPFSIQALERFLLKLVGKSTRLEPQAPKPPDISESLPIPQPKPAPEGPFDPLAKPPSHALFQKKKENVVFEPKYAEPAQEDHLMGIGAKKEPERIFSPYIVREKTGEEMAINKPIFRIGKKKSTTDFLVSDNTAVSRNHVDIITRGVSFYIIDHNSTNKTYVDGKIIPPEKEIEILSGTKIRLANEEFTFYEYKTL